MNPWIFVIISALAVALGYATPASAFDLTLGGSVGASSSSSTSGSSSTFDAGAELGLTAELGGSGEPGDGPSVPASGNANASASVAASIIAAADVQSRLETVIRLIETSDWSVDSFAGLTSVAGSTAFNVDGWLTTETEAAFDAALEANWDEVQELHAAIEANGTFEAWLEGGDLSSENVVAVGQTADGSLAVFTSGS